MQTLKELATELNTPRLNKGEAGILFNEIKETIEGNWTTEGYDIDDIMADIKGVIEAITT